MARLSEHDCPYCTCGMTELSWSDRRSYARLDDLEQVAECVAACALDHHYDRTEDGVPWGIPDAWRPALAAVVERHLSAVCPAWRETTVHMWDVEGAREAFLADVLAALRALDPVAVAESDRRAANEAALAAYVWTWRELPAQFESKAWRWSDVCYVCPLSRWGSEFDTNERHWREHTRLPAVVRQPSWRSVVAVRVGRDASG